MKNIHSKKLTALKISSVILSFLFYTGCKSSPSNSAPQSYDVTVANRVAKGPGEISVMTFNVENTFDTVHNDGTDDYTYLPLNQKNTPTVKAFCKSMSNPYYRNECYTKNWDKPVMDFKLSQISKVISYVDSGRGPDNLILAEVENLNILTELVQGHLTNLGYKTISILKGPDTRGINTAFISKFPQVGKSILHIIPYHDADPEKEKKAQKSRGILETTVKINNKDVTFLAAHFPSQSNPTEWRHQAIDFMKNLMQDMQSKGRTVIAGGDLNIIEEEETQFGYFNKILASVGSVSHLVGCKKCQGTHYYKGQWAFLDVLVFSNNLQQVAGLTLIPDSFEVVKAPAHTNPKGNPIRFDEIKREGVSDHFPLYSRLKISL